MNIYIASGFCKNNGGGNRAGVVLEAGELSYERKQEIAKILGFSETVFFSESEKADFKLEYFTPTEEVPLCGHATIASFSMLREIKQLEKDNYTIETKSGILRIQIEEDGLVYMEQNCPTFDVRLEPDVFTNCIEREVIDGNLPIQIVSTGLRDIMLPIKSCDKLDNMKPNLEQMSKLSRENEVVGVHAFALSDEQELTAICRNFAPLYGIDEESATGTSNCALACYLFKYFKKQEKYVFEQGVTMGVESQILVKLEYHEDVIDTVFVGGYGHLLEQRML